MQVPLQIAFHNIDHPELVKALIEEKVAWLERFYDRITACRVVVRAPHRRHRQGNPFQARIDLTVPGGEIVVNRDPSNGPGHKDLNAVICEAFDNARRRLEEHVRRLRKEVKNHEAPAHARVSRLFLDEGYGFVQTADGREVYFHRHALLNGDFQKLQVGTEVTFAEEAGEKGPQASSLRLVGRPPQRRAEHSSGSDV
jgi:ribosomal subunit interface protein